jgi:hypothetical protein
MYPDLMADLPVKVSQHYEGYNKNGVIIVPPIFSAGYQAFDATCTRNITEEATSINLDKGEFTATCPRCKTVYSLIGGYAQNQSFRLQRYAAYESNGRIYVTH